MAEDITPGSPRWFLNRLTQRLLSRQHRYDWLERYALGNHPLPDADKRFVFAMRNVQRMARSNYCGLISMAVVERMSVNGFQFGPEEQVDEDAKRIWNANYMDIQTAILFKMAADFGEGYLLVSPIDEETGEPVITAESPRMCITERDPQSAVRDLAGFKMWHSSEENLIHGILYMPDVIYHYTAPGHTDLHSEDTNALTQRLTAGAGGEGFTLLEAFPNELGAVPLIHANWQPSFGTMGRAEFEDVIDAQNRVNYTIFHRLVIARNQAFNQRWVSGIKEKPNFKPGSDMVWATRDSDSRFGQFEAADLTQLLEATRDDIGDMASISRTPAAYLINRLTNVGGDALTLDQAPLIKKIETRQRAMNYSLQRAIRYAFQLKGNTAKAKETEVKTLWADAEVHTLAEMGDLFSKLTTGGVPLDIAMKATQMFTDDQIKSAKEQFEEQQKLQQEMALEQQESATEGQIAVEKSKPAPAAGRPSGKGK